MTNSPLFDPSVDEVILAQSKYEQVMQDNYILAKAAQEELDGTDEQLLMKIDQDGHMRKKMDLSKDIVILTQQAVMDDLKSKISELESQFKQLELKEEELRGYAKRYTSEIMAQELQDLKTEFQRTLEDQEIQWKKVHSRHELSIDTTKKRADRIINDAETVAADHELARIPESTIDSEHLNRRLKKELKQAYDHNEKLKKIVQEMEDKNMDLICESVQVDWNLMYQEDDLPEDYWPQERSVLWAESRHKRLPPLDKKPKPVCDAGLTADEIIHMQMKRNILDQKLIVGQLAPLHHGMNDAAGQKYYHPRK
ncbi:hypothetical protein EDD86DRAFT_190923 [Gorgonomyces haynaldii]|nr:hypothetical protein EDD86DRAFT_190923 [Gorgonomyces haynaldii]